MDGATAAERICPWRRSSVPDEGRSSSVSSANDSYANDQTSSNATDPHLHPSPLTSATFSGVYHKSPEYLGEYATTTKQEEHVSRPHIRDLFDDPSRTPDEENENKIQPASDDSTTRL
jgi:hypothetical protein